MLKVEFRNDDSGDDYTGNYNVTVYENNHTVWKGRVEGHYRGLDWRSLVQMWLNQEREKDTDVEDDGFGNEWSPYCHECRCKSIQIVGLGKVQCCYCG